MSSHRPGSRFTLIFLRELNFEFLSSAMIEDSRIYALREQYELPEDEPIPKDLLDLNNE